jgi:hypothetical protein
MAFFGLKIRQRPFTNIADLGWERDVNKSALFAASATAALFLTSAAMAGDTANASNDNLTIEQASQSLHYSGGNDRMRVEIAPNYSEELGFSLKGAVGGYLTDAMALGLIVEYGEHKREYLANAGIQFTDALSFVGTVGMLEEHNEYVDGEDREKVQQMEYGASLKGAYEVGFISGFELNGYLADADADSDSVETGKLYGVQLLADLDLTDTTHFKLGGGYEWLEWDDTGEDDNRWTFSAEAAQQLGDVVSLTGRAKLGASEYVYGGGLAFDLSNGGMNTNTIGVNYSYIDGKNGIEDDQRVELSWSIGFGAGPTTSVAAADLTDRTGTIRAAADVAMVSPASNLLGDVMKRPAFLPERVLARAKAESGSVARCSAQAFTNSAAEFTILEAGIWAVGQNTADIETDFPPTGIGTFDIYYGSDATLAPASVTLLQAAVVIPDQLNEPNIPLGSLQINDVNNYLWAFYDNAGVCTAIYWGTDD